MYVPNPTPRMWMAMQITQRVLDRLSDSDNLIDTAPQNELVAEISRVVREELETAFVLVPRSAA